MRVRVDLDSDALYFRLSEEAIDSSAEVSSGVILDYDKNGKVVGIELLGIKGKFSADDLSHLTVDLQTILDRKAEV